MRPRTPPSPRWPSLATWWLVLLGLVSLSWTAAALAAPVRELPRLLSSSKYQSLRSLEAQESSPCVPETRIRGSEFRGEASHQENRRLKLELIGLFEFAYGRKASDALELSRDPIGFAGGLNLYAYVSNNPINYRDPRGLFVVAPWILYSMYAAATATVAYNVVDQLSPETTRPVNDAVARAGLAIDQGILNAEIAISNASHGVIQTRDFQALGVALGLYSSGVFGPKPSFGDIALQARSACSAAAPAAGVVGPGGALSAEDLAAASSSTGRTLRMVTRLTGPPEAGRALSVATGEGAEALAAAAREVGDLYTGNVPYDLVRQLQRIGLAQTSQTMMDGVAATEVRFLPPAAAHVAPYFRKE